MIDERKDLFVWGAGHTGREIISLKIFTFKSLLD